LLDCPESTQNQVKTAWGAWLANLRPWEWFTTLTFKAPKQGTYDRRGIAYVRRAVREFEAEAVARMPWAPGHEEGVHSIEAVWAIERHVNGSPHVHGLLAARGGELVGPELALQRARLGRRMGMVDWAWEGPGMARVEAVRDLGAAYYVTKYILKGGPECLILNVSKY